MFAELPDLGLSQVDRRAWELGAENGSPLGPWRVPQLSLNFSGLTCSWLLDPYNQGLLRRSWSFDVRTPTHFNAMSRPLARRWDTCSLWLPNACEITCVSALSGAHVTLTGTPELQDPNIGALIIRMGFWGPPKNNYNKDPPK